MGSGPVMGGGTGVGSPASGDPVAGAAGSPVTGGPARGSGGPARGSGELARGSGQSARGSGQPGVGNCVPVVRAGMERAARLAARSGITVPPLRGKLLRPVTAFSFVPPARRNRLDARFWLGCLAVQMVHEASLHHDDVLDGGFGRRNGATLLAREGPGAALLAGDLYLTGAYRVALMTGWDAFVAEFVAAVAATVRGEKLQGELTAAPDPAARYEEVVRAKSGALFGAAAALAGCVGRKPGEGVVPLSPQVLRALGVELGAFYQLVDDFLDYCPAEDTGKPKLQDFHNRVWTFVLGARGREWFERAPAEAAREFFRPGSARTVDSMAECAAVRLEARGSALTDRLQALRTGPEIVRLVDGWTSRCLKAARHGAPAALAVPPVPPGRLRKSEATTAASIAARALALGPRAQWGRYFSRNSRTFSFASLLFPPAERERVREIYAFCRFTDDLVDESGDRAEGAVVRLHETLDVWAGICGLAYEGHSTGIPLADVVMGNLARQRIPFDLACELIEGVRMDVEPHHYSSMDELRGYTYRVASVVGAWLTRAFGVRDPWVLERAHALGHAMQLTNIVRDVGEDLEMGRIYLPADRMAVHGVTPESLAAMQALTAAGGSVDEGYIALLEEIMSVADSSYTAAYQGMPGLPPFFQRPVAVAAQVYRGIQDKVRTNGYDNLNRRAYTTLREKVVLANRGLGRLRSRQRQPELADVR